MYQSGTKEQPNDVLRCSFIVNGMAKPGSKGPSIITAPCIHLINDTSLGDVREAKVKEHLEHLPAWLVQNYIVDQPAASILRVFRAWIHASFDAESNALHAYVNACNDIGVKVTQQDASDEYLEALRADRDVDKTLNDMLHSMMKRKGGK